MKIAALVLIVLVACSDSSRPMQPFQIPAWSSLPSDDELVRAIVGSGGTGRERAAAEQAVRDLLLPSLEQDKTLEELRWHLETLQREYARSDYPEPMIRLLRVGVRNELQRLGERALLLAQKRLHDALWPTEPVPELWTGIEKLAPLRSTDEIIAAATSIEKRLADIRQRYGFITPGETRSELLILNHVQIARTGGYKQTTGTIFDVLVQRGIESMPLPSDPW